MKKIISLLLIMLCNGEGVMNTKRLFKRKILIPGAILTFLITSAVFLLIHAISGSEEAFIIGARLFIASAIVGIIAIILEIIKARNLPYFYSILGFFFGIAILLLLPHALQPEYVMLGVIFFFNFIDIARKKSRKALLCYFTGVLLFSIFYCLAIFSGEIFAPLFITGLCVYGSLFYLGLRV